MLILRYCRRRLAALRLSLMLLAAMLCGAAGAGELVLVVSAKNPLRRLEAGQAADIFLGQSVRFPDGREAGAVDQRVGAPLRDEFYASVAGMSPARLKAYWTKMIFTGRAQPPRELADSAAVRRAVAGNPALLGYIDSDALDDSVRAVLVVR